MILENLKQDLQELTIKERSEFLPKFFKTGVGEYGEGDIFIGVTVPNCRMVAKKYQDLSLLEVEELLSSKIHEEREVALMILVEQFRKGIAKTRELIYNFYLKHTKYVNNWDLVDGSSYNIVGLYLLDKPRDILYKLVYSKDIWERRIAIVSTMAFIRKDQIVDTLKISKILLTDKHDLIQKAVGWLLREMGKKDEHSLVKFLKENYCFIPRTTLRYAIERFPENIRKSYLSGKF